MTVWVKCDYSFDHRSAVLVLRDRSADRSISKEIWKLFEQPDQIEGFLHALIDKHLPAYSGCTINYMAFDYARRSILIGITHRSLAPVPIGEACPEIEWNYLAKKEPHDGFDSASAPAAFNGNAGPSCGQQTGRSRADH